jgi:hypothetical protein
MPRRGEGSFFFCKAHTPGQASGTGSIKPAHAQRKARNQKPETRACSLEARKTQGGEVGRHWALGQA